ncbi:MAG: hypothetical protein IJ600_10520, partial [Lachnospiraceae bacterium]|nr:hypothetical protein [Lachnospiraceae bacterium]
FTALRAVIVTGFANENRLRRWAKPFSPGMFWVVIAQQVRDSTVNSNAAHTCAHPIPSEPLSGCMIIMHHLFFPT